VASDNKTSTLDSDFGSDSGPDCESDSDCGSDHDSGYNSEPSRDAKAEYYRQKRAGFAAEGPIMSDLSDTLKAMVRAEEQKWNA
jgi:hypothetical protein